MVLMLVASSSQRTTQHNEIAPLKVYQGDFLPERPTMIEITRPLLLIAFLTAVAANRVYVHPFGMFALGNGSCKPTHALEVTPLETVSLTSIEDGVEPDPVHTYMEQRGNVSQRTAVLAQLLNTLGQRFYDTLQTQKAPNGLFSPVNAYGALVAFYLGAWGATASQLQKLLGLEKETDKPDCVSPFDGHKVLRTLCSINALMDGSADELKTPVWVFSNANLSKSFARGIWEYSNTSYTRAVDLSQPLKAQSQLNAFMEKTSAGKSKLLFQDINSTSDLLFASAVHFKGKWRTMFRPEATSPQEFWIDDKTSVTVPLMTHTGKYSYLDDKRMKCTVLKLALSRHAYMLLVLPYEGAHLDHIEKQLTARISDWSHHLKEGVLEVSLPKLSLNAVSDLKSILSNMGLPNLLGTGANFTHFSRKEHFTVGKVLNEVVFEMSEEGSEQQDESQGDEAELKLTFNRPFCFTVIEGSSGAILLLGRIGNPTN
ncbi:hypothetical protein SKAU_G00164730 [Synaphobranchus kaupii]|uniref:Angiotensinogen n=1 Tax=Synaphobranchus kaupii TaxID=118154 RepID=A0A9Q1FJ76_SYNKA|nr:hypothetical protein SKAU_G00164730 [Synaphobranchus kaupii]